MTGAYCERRDFPVLTRWLYASSDLSRPDHRDQCAECLLMRSERWPRCPLHAPTSPTTHPDRFLAVLHPTIKVGADIKSP
jgi:hypothetical protein